MVLPVGGGLLAELPANRSRREHVAVDVHVVILRILPDVLDSTSLTPAMRALAVSVPAKAPANSGTTTGPATVVDPIWMCAAHGAVDPSPAEVEADLSLALVEGDARRPGGVGIARSRHLRGPGEHGALPGGAIRTEW
jgi:hypothetical protein